MHIAYHVSETARHSGLAEVEVLTVLLAMVNRASRNTALVTWELLLAEFKDPKPNSSKIERALENLEEKEIVRKQPDYDQGSFTWALDHRYLCRGVLQLERPSQYWSLFLEDATVACQAARGSWQVWKALLSKRRYARSRNRKEC